MAEALEREAEEAERAADEGEGEDAGSRRGVIDALELLDALHSQTGESRDAILGWAWKRFCAEWARLYPAAERERRRAERRRQEESFRQLEQAGRRIG